MLFRSTACEREAFEAQLKLEAGDADYAAVGRILDCVREQVRDHLRQAIRIASHWEGRRRERNVEQMLRALAREELGLLANDSAHAIAIGRDRCLLSLGTLI